MPLTICKILGLNELKLTTVALRLANHSVRHPLDILENILVKVGNFVIPIDFVVLEMNADPWIPFILRRSFLTTAGAVIDIKNHELSLSVEGDKI